MQYSEPMLAHASRASAVIHVSRPFQIFVLMRRYTTLFDGYTACTNLIRLCFALQTETPQSGLQLSDGGAARSLEPTQPIEPLEEMMQAVTENCLHVCLLILPH